MTKKDLSLKRFSRFFSIPGFFPIFSPKEALSSKAILRFIFHYAIYLQTMFYFIIESEFQLHSLSISSYQKSNTTNGSIEIVLNTSNRN